MEDTETDEATYDERVTLPGINFDRVDCVRLRIDSIGLDDVHGVVVNTEFVERITR